MGSDVVSLGIEKFIEQQLPERQVELDVVVADLKKRKALVYRGRSKVKSSSQKQSSSGHPSPRVLSHTFKKFKTLFQSDTTTKPSRVMKTLQTIVATVRSALARVTNCEVADYALRLEDNIESTVHGCITSKLDGPVRSTDVLVPIMGIDSGDVHLSPKEIDFILMSLIARIMNKDARRKFCFAVTFEGPEVTLWKFTRSLHIKSTAFDMSEYPDLLIQLFVSLLGARNDLLGYDPLVTLLPDENYIYEMPSDGDTGPRYYRTIASICDTQASYVTGRCLRVWEVEQVESVANPVRVPGTPTRVLKDVFLDSGMRTESDIQEELFADIANLAADDSWTSRPLLRDFPRSDIDALADTLEGEKFKRFFSCIIAKHVGAADEVGGVFASLSPSSASEDTPPPPKRRCLFVYEHVCTALNDIPVLGDAVEILKQALIPLHLMFCAGWVHRDVSPGNILALRATSDEPWVVKLSDLEHAKRFPDPESPGEKNVTGTPYFIAYEIIYGYQLFPATADPKFPSWSYKYVPIVHSFQHDLESIFWIILWLISMRIDQEVPREFGKTYFQQRVDHGYALARYRAFTKPLYIQTDLEKSLRPTSLLRSRFVSTLENLRKDLYEQYISRNKEARYHDPSSYSWIMSKAFNKFFDAVDECKDRWGDIALMVDSKPRKVSPPPPPPSSSLNQGDDVTPPIKRRARDSGEEGRASKRVRINAAEERPIVPRWTGPKTRSMTRNEGRITRSTTRWLQEEEKQKKRRL
ncbi:other/FunK1 protein kinase [Coprinopsis cinerea okayama7|uniref:Other/FunK1 protein kinase n=1 Tax=Coprinopsis cinerea (strain Okayama-7 / 130 / ATCC MYA-4618 / FGSC 9003) TaxID=240176 RepID=A8NAW6_COPC7|nr:other/FunK1 protein kinase [Coprinopsis cinerea okayama7\|eukprot:XP_001831968.2 other/FunK1 protein kinase [Coprinopsis cinerea okayama7\